MEMLIETSFNSKSKIKSSIAYFLTRWPMKVHYLNQLVIPHITHT